MWLNVLTLKAMASMLALLQPLLLGKNGVEERQSIGKLSAFEQAALEGMLDTLKKISLWAKVVNN
ncbi:hypothetical protein ACNKHK_20920 [Shigella flexneri]